MSILFMLSLSSVDAYHIRCRCWPRLLVVHLEGNFCLVRFTADGAGAFSSGGRVCLIFPYFWMFLMGWHGVICDLSFSFLCLMVFSAARCLRLHLFPRLGLLGPRSQTFSLRCA
jgi:hypothetical protein